MAFCCPLAIGRGCWSTLTPAGICGSLSLSYTSCSATPHPHATRRCLPHHDCGRFWLWSHQHWCHRLGQPSMQTGTRQYYWSWLSCRWPLPCSPSIAHTIVPPFSHRLKTHSNKIIELVYWKWWSVVVISEVIDACAGFCAGAGYFSCFIIAHGHNFIPSVISSWWWVFLACWCWCRTIGRYFRTIPSCPSEIFTPTGIHSILCQISIVFLSKNCTS